MKTIYLRGLLWLYLLGFGYTVSSGEPGFLDFDNLPDTNFSCVGKVIGGYYADLETNCQMFHVCTIGQLDEPMDIRFLCLNGTVFDQETRVCERIDEVDCSKSEQFYSLNLELYGNTQPSLGEENTETDPPIIIKASTTTTTTTTTPKPKPKSTRPPFYTTSAPAVTTVTKVISSHHFPISNSPDIRFNPEEINISLNPGSPPNVRSKTVAYQQQVFSDSNNNNKKVVVTTHTSYGTSAEKEDFMRVVPHTKKTQVSSTQKSPATPADINYGFTYHQTDSNQEYRTEHPQHNYQYHHHSSLPSYRHAQFRNQFKTTTYRTDNIATTRKLPYSHKEPTTFRTPYVSSLKTPTYHSYSRTEKPQRLQLPIPLLPTLPPLTFSSPAPFSLGHHIESKRYTNDHQPPPRIIISASASVSDASGRRLNYSLGTIGVAPLLEEPPRSYDDYKEHDVVLDPFYQDVPKIKSKRRRKRQTSKAPDANEQAAADVLKFLFDWYSSQQKSTTIKVPIDPEVITEINEQLAPIVEAPAVQQKSDDNLNFRDSDLFKRRSKFNIIGDVLSITEEKNKTVEKSSQNETTTKPGNEDYVDDNYEAVAHQKNVNENEKRKENKVEKEEASTTTTTEIPTTTLEPTTTTTEPTTTSRIMGIVRSRAIAHQKRIRKENQRRYSQFLASIKPKIRTMNKVKTTKSTTAGSVVTTTSEVTPVPELLEITTTPPLEELLETTTFILKNKDTLFQDLTANFTEDNEKSHSEESVSVIEAPQEESASVKDESQIVEVTKEISTTTGEVGVSDKANDEVRIDEETESYFEEPSTIPADELKHSETTTKDELQVEKEINITEENIQTTQADTTEETTFATEEPQTEKVQNTESSSELVTEPQTSKTRIRGRGRVKYLTITSPKPETTTEIFDEPKTTEDVLTTTATIDNSYQNSNTESEYKSSDGKESQTEQNLEEEIDADRLESRSFDENESDEKKSEIEENLEQTTITDQEDLLDQTEGVTSTTAANEDDNKLNTTFTDYYDETTYSSPQTTPEVTTSTSTTELSTSEFFQTVTTEPSLPTSTTEEISVTNLTPAATTTTETPSFSRGRSANRKKRPQRIRPPSSYRRPNSRHRFSTEITSQPSSRKPKIELEIVDALTSQLTTTETLIYSTSPKILTSTVVDIEDVAATDAPLFKSANPTQAESAKESLHTTPLSMTYKLHVRKEKLRSYIFNCFGKTINKFYSDPRDCRLFHYCTSGYTKNQLLDMKFVCDLGTYFDEEKLICTKIKPERCL